METMAKIEQANSIQVVDPYVSEKKFQHELDIFLGRKDFQRKRGIVLLEANFPNIELMFMAPQLIPTPVAFTVRINFSNYDLEPPSITFIDPTSGELVNATKLLTHFPRKIGVNENGEPIRQNLLQFEKIDGIPFICIPGVREYHNHPAHTGDSWLLHRKSGGEGSLGYLIDKLYDYGITSLSNYNLPIQFMASVNGLQFGINLNNLPE